jgi:hypothetical protein
MSKEDEKPEVKEGELVAAPDFRPLMHYRRGDETRVYNLRVVADGAELWAVTEACGRVPRAVKEGLFTNVDEALEFLEEVHRTMVVGGWRETAPPDAL